MILVRVVVVGAEHGPEALARALVDDPQEFLLGRGAAFPVPADGDPPAVGEVEGGDVDGIGGGVGREPVGPGDVAAIVAAEGPERR